METTIGTEIFPGLKTRTKCTEVLSDRLTPVEAFYLLRDFSIDPILLESSDYHKKDQSSSYLCIDPIAEIAIQNQRINARVLNERLQYKIDELNQPLTAILDSWVKCVSPKSTNDQSSRSNGVFGYTSFDACHHFGLSKSKKAHSEIPDILYRFYRFILVFDHFHFKLTFIENCPEGQSSRLPELEKALRSSAPATSPVTIGSERTSNNTEEEFLEMVRHGLAHCARGDVFQIVLSRRFSRSYEGDIFALYRTLRSVSPSPYLFYFDYGSFKLMGSSPESQLVITENKAQIYPIAGTYARTGDDNRDRELAKALQKDPKENSEHVMLVDLARNDLNRICDDVQVAFFKQSQFFSHVIHMTSKIEGQLRNDVSPFEAIAKTLPAGTLSGAPKSKALELIAKYEKTPRGIYGGAVGYINFRGEVNHAILIRSFLCKNQQLHYQAGAGIVMASDPAQELQEVENKVAALEAAIHSTSTIRP